MNITQYHLDYFKKRSDVELFKLIDFYFLSGRIDSIKDRINLNDSVSYMGNVELFPNILYSRLVSMRDAKNNLLENANKFGITLDNNLVKTEPEVKLISIDKEDGKYRSRLFNMDYDTIIKVYDNIVEWLNANQTTDIKVLYDKYSSDIEKKKVLDSFSDLSNKALFKFAIITNESTKEKLWLVFDSNDKKLRAEYEMKNEFHI